MNQKKFASNLEGLGLLGIMASLFWWWKFYSPVAQSFGSPNALPPLECLFSHSGACGIVSTVASYAGASPYEPTLFWISLAVLVVGTLIRTSSRP
jgi:hypothetical protein